MDEDTIVEKAQKGMGGYEGLVDEANYENHGLIQQEFEPVVISNAFDSLARAEEEVVIEQTPSKRKRQKENPMFLIRTTTKWSLVKKLATLHLSAKRKMQ